MVGLEGNRMSKIRRQEEAAYGREVTLQEAEGGWRGGVLGRQLERKQGTR